MIAIDGCLGNAVVAWPGDSAAAWIGFAAPLGNAVVAWPGDGAAAWIGFAASLGNAAGVWRWWCCWLAGRCCGAVTR